MLQQRILQMRLDHRSFDSIAAELGYSDTYVKKMYHKAMREFLVEDVKQVRKFELMKLDMAEREVLNILRDFHPIVSHGTIVYDSVETADGEPIIGPTGEPKRVKLRDAGPRLAALDRYLKIQDARARLLGLNAPVKTALTDPTGEREASILAGSLQNLSIEELSALEAVLTKLGAVTPEADEDGNDGS